MTEGQDWESFWDLASPEAGAAALLEFYGPEASQAAADCAVAALADDREQDYHFWSAVLSTLKIAERRSFEAAKANAASRTQSPCA